MGKPRIDWFKNAIVICMIIAAFSSNTFAKEEIKAPLLTGELWVKMSSDQKSA